MAVVDMEMFVTIIPGLQLATEPINLWLILIGSLLGTLIGAIPGLGAIHGVAILLPISYALKLPVESTLIFLLTIYYGCEYGGRIASQLALSEKEDPEPMLVLTGLGSFCGGLISIAGLTIAVLLLKLLKINFGPAEYFVMVIFAFSVISVQAGERPLKTLLSACVGLMLATIGIDSTTGVLRFTLGHPELYDGIEFTTVAIGIFVISEIFLLMEQAGKRPRSNTVIGKIQLDWRAFLQSKWLILRSGMVGFGIGVLPGRGANTASEISEKLESQRATDGQQRLLARETANNAAAGGTVLPLLALGIPGSGTGAILLGALLLYNITPGPSLFNQQTELVWGLIIAALIGNLILLILNIPLLRLFTRVHLIPTQVLTSALLTLAFVSGFAVHGSQFSLLLLALLGLFGYLLQKRGYPLVPLLLGFVLGELMENNLRRALAISGGDIGILFISPSSKIFWFLSLLAILFPMLWQRWKGRRQ